MIILGRIHNLKCSDFKSDDDDDSIITHQIKSSTYK